MKKLLFFFALCMAFNGYAQTTTTTKTVLNDKTIVKDVNGNVIPYIIWSKLVESGEYSVKSQDKTNFTLFMLSPEEKVAAAERRKTMAMNMAKPKASDAFREGDKFRGERVTDINGNKYDLKNEAGKIYVINFWFINCAPCKKEIPELNELVTKYKDNKDVIFLAIALDEKYAIKDFLKTMPFNYNIIHDGRYYAQKYGVKGYPTHVVIGKDGLIKFSTLGLALNTVHWVDQTISEQIATL